LLRDAYARNYAFEGDYWWFVGRRALVASALQPVLKNDGARLLDVGCGTGYNLESLRGRCRGFGVDLAAEGLAFCRERGLERLAQASAERLPYPDASFDVVTALDVLEHIDDDLAALHEWGRVLRPGGRLVLFVPAFEFLWSGEDYVSQHRRRYRRGPLESVLREAGFAVRKLTYANFLLLPGVVGPVLFQRLFRPRSMYESNLKPLPGPLNRLLGTIFAQEARLLAHRDAAAGSSLFAVAERPVGHPGVWQSPGAKAPG
jgi:SAM-dependent methyltransferase